LMVNKNTKTTKQVKSNQKLMVNKNTNTTKQVKINIILLVNLKFIKTRINFKRNFNLLVN
jgi:hypothetical protein